MPSNSTKKPISNLDSLDSNSNPSKPSTLDNQATTIPLKSSTKVIRKTKQPSFVSKTTISTDLPDKSFFSDPSNIGQHTKVLSHIGKIYNLGPLNPTVAKQVDLRIRWYFNRCATEDIVPNVSSLARALGVTRRTLFDWADGKLKNCPSEPVSKALGTIEAIHETLLIEGKINPVAAIFLAKNNFGYSDKTPTMDDKAPETEKTAEQLIAESMMLPETDIAAVVPKEDNSVD